MGSPISVLIAEILVQYYETLNIKTANENKLILFYTRYFDILTIYGHTKITSEQISPYTNSIHTNLQIPPTHEINTINILNLHICGNTKGLDIDVYRKPNCTDTTIHFSSNHPHVTESSSLQIPYTYYPLTLKTNTKNGTPFYTSPRPKYFPNQ